MRGRNTRFMRDRITHIKTPKQFRILPILLSITIALAAAGCALTKAEETTADTGGSTSETIAVTEPPLPTQADDPSPTPGIEPQIWSLPDVGELPDGQYTVSMTPFTVDGEDSGESAVFVPWTQVEVDQDYIDSLKIGDIIELPDGEGSVTVTDLIEKDIGESVLYGTTYTGKILVIDAVDYWTFEQTESGTWKLFSISDTPVYSSADPMRLLISPDVRIFDAYHPGLHGWPEGMTNDDITAFVEFRDTSLSEGYVDSIEAFFEYDVAFIYQYGSDLTLATYNWTVITVEDNMITEIYFCYHP